MSLTVGGAFSTFRNDSVDLESTQTDSARTSRDYLFGRIRTIAAEDKEFPKLYSSFIPYGSFARKTKIRPLDDIDFLVPLDGSGTQSDQSLVNAYTYWLRITDNTKSLARFSNDNGYVNSTKVLNKFKLSLANVPSYSKAEIKKTQQAVTLKLTSYDWTFDIVPAVPISGYLGQVDYYLIPNGSGNWIRTDPRKDASRITELNSLHNGNFLALTRLLKFWNKRTTKPALGSYHFETIVGNVFQHASPVTNLSLAFEQFFRQGQASIYSSCPDPKGLGRPLDEGIDYSTRQKIAEAMAEAAKYAGYANMYERLDQPKIAIYNWGMIFGPQFPTYG